MKKAEYIAELKRRLANFSPSEVEDAVSYCEEYFEEAGDGNDQQVIDDFWVNLIHIAHKSNVLSS